MKRQLSPWSLAKHMSGYKWIILDNSVSLLEFVGNDRVISMDMDRWVSYNTLGQGHWTLGSQVLEMEQGNSHSPAHEMNF